MRDLVNYLKPKRLDNSNILYTYTVADLGGGWGDAFPPTSLKVTISAEKSASIWNNSAPFGDASPPHQSQPNDFGRKTTLNFGEDLFFFWRPPDFGRKKSSNLRFRPKIQSQNRRRPFFFFFGDHLILGEKNLRI